MIAVLELRSVGKTYPPPTAVTALANVDLRKSGSFAGDSFNPIQYRRLAVAKVVDYEYVVARRHQFHGLSLIHI